MIAPIRASQPSPAAALAVASARWDILWIVPAIAPAVISVALSASAGAQPAAPSWLDSSSFESWNRAGMSIPRAPQGENPDPRCREAARAPASDEDRGLRAQGWDLIGAPTVARQTRVIAGAADYDGMCRPRQYQYFVFRRGMFAGTLSPHLMDSRTDGALGRVTILSDGRLRAEYRRYAPADPLCCPTRTTRVVFSLENDPPVLTALSASTVSNLSPAP
jgi:LppP/LprE lipoprotein